MRPGHPFFILLAVMALSACSGRAVRLHSEEAPPIYPDYVGVTVPANIAPLNFMLSGRMSGRKVSAVFSSGQVSCRVVSGRGVVRIPMKAWKRLTGNAQGGSVEVSVSALGDDGWTRYEPFKIFVSQDKVDPYIAYRLIEPAQEIWNHMGIYQRHVENFKETPIIENSSTDGNCMNCHSFLSRDPGVMLFHMRVVNPGTMLIKDRRLEKLNTKTDKTISALVYPYWHPSGRYVAFSVNDTKQAFHTTDTNRVEVFDMRSDVVVYDVDDHRVILSPTLTSKGSFETFPTFSPDGGTLYFCSADSLPMPGRFSDLRYSLCSVSFDPATGAAGDVVDTLYKGKSVSFPRVSPNGRFLLMTLSEYGNFSIWHQDADLWLVDLRDGSARPLESANSDRSESYHSWSGNSRWVVFSSRREDGLYTRPYFVHIDGEGNTSKPFVLPQKDPGYHKRLMKSYNIPEMISGPVKYPARSIARKAKKDKGIDVTS
ncbi:MAG: PD40 domain-containing protein [Bacteroidales bacterium]|nr:PD40 domain-containing protein [Bacteroidales bacterium]